MHSLQAVNYGRTCTPQLTIALRRRDSGLWRGSAVSQGGGTESRRNISEVTCTESGRYYHVCGRVRGEQNTLWRYHRACGKDKVIVCGARASLKGRAYGVTGLRATDSRTSES